ncbi:hypothetical protein DN730_00145 [Marinomonas piezotolerans]|uniref:DUF1738 domain-containing protein n=1 Tax=Marinomonas piezotolerans TaxID=2213058 RepID=A0A370UCJ0_9GAMM|nr:zincin-like metallopeptidase domain-containing protein [Marinomonas piezotolerans]RDL45500.1 hypothetical protein DN730_00145 [Marinomonas piezotolerans]
MDTISYLRSRKAIQLKFSLQTGRSVSYIIDRANYVEDGRKFFHGNVKISNFLGCSIPGRPNLKVLSEEDLLEYPISILRSVSKAIFDLECLVESDFFNIYNLVKNKHSTTILEKIFLSVDFKDSFWSKVTKFELLELLDEYSYWVDWIVYLEFVKVEICSAKIMLEELNRPLFKQLRNFSCFVESGWDKDEKVFKSILSDIDFTKGDFLVEWLENFDKTNIHYNILSRREYNSLYSWFLLTLIYISRNYKSNVWGTAKQWKRKGYVLKENAKPAAVFHNFLSKDKINPETNEFESGFYGKKTSIVYNSEEVLSFDGMKYGDNKVAKFEKIDDRLSELCVEVLESNSAYYDIDEDVIYMPEKRFFIKENSTASYYSTLLHEVIHWTGSDIRCNRNIRNDFGSDSYALEELVAELGANFLSSRFGFRKKVSKNSIRYIISWLSGLNKEQWLDSLEEAAVLANKASNFVMYK